MTRIYVFRVYTDPANPRTVRVPASEVEVGEVVVRYEVTVVEEVERE